MEEFIFPWPPHAMFSVISVIEIMTVSTNPDRESAVQSCLPGQADWFFGQVSSKVPISVAGIAGPGDPFADPEPTLETLRKIRTSHPEAILCVSSNGMNILSSIKELAELKVSHVTITVNAIRADIGAKIYKWIRVGKKTFRGEEGATLLLENQAGCHCIPEGPRHYGKN